MDKPERSADIDLEALQIGLDQLSQTLEVMARVVGRLKHQIADSRPAGERRSTDVTAQPHGEQGAPMH